MDDFATRLSQRLGEPLLGLRAHARFSPAMTYGRHLGPAAFDTKPAAVLALFYPINDAIHLALTLRPSTMASHAGQVCLPGGMKEKGETLQEAAQREMSEELGVDGSQYTILGKLSQIYVFASNFLVTPFVAYSNTRPEFIPSAAEVDRVIELPMSDLLNPVIESLRIQRGPLDFSAPCFRYNGDRIWGATTMMLAELADVIR